MGLFSGLGKSYNLNFSSIIREFFYFICRHAYARARVYGVFTPSQTPVSDPPSRGGLPWRPGWRPSPAVLRPPGREPPLPENLPPGKVPIFSSCATYPGVRGLLRRLTRGIFLPYPAPLKYPRCAILSHPGNPVACPLSRFMPLLYYIPTPLSSLLF